MLRDLIGYLDYLDYLDCLDCLDCLDHLDCLDCLDCLDHLDAYSPKSEAEIKPETQRTIFRIFFSFLLFFSSFFCGLEGSVISARVWERKGKESQALYGKAR